MLSKKLKEKIQQKPIQYLDLLYDLLPENEEHAKHILQLMEELIKEKKLNNHLLYRHMEKPLFFQDKSGQDFMKRDPLIAKLVRLGGLNLFNYYLKFKYGSVLSAELMAIHDIFSFNIPPIKNYINISNVSVLAEKEVISRINEKYYALYGMSYELLGDIFQENKTSTLQRLVECQFDLNKQSTIEHLKKYLYMNFDKSLQISDENMQFLLENGLNPDKYLDVFLTGLWDEFAMINATHTHYSLIHLINFLLEHNAILSRFPRDFLEKLQQLLENKIEKVNLLLDDLVKQNMLEEMWYLNASLIECLQSLDAAKAYYLKAGQKGLHATRRKELINLLKVMKNLSNTE